MLLSIVVPVYNEEENIANFYKAVTDVMSGLTYDYELIFVDDGSSDSSAMILREIAYNDKHVKVLLHLARNFGHQTALTCGLDYAHGDAVITMDGDMQHPPALFLNLLGCGSQAMMWCAPYAIQLKMLVGLNLSRLSIITN